MQLFNHQFIRFSLPIQDAFRAQKHCLLSALVKIGRAERASVRLHRGRFKRKYARFSEIRVYKYIRKRQEKEVATRRLAVHNRVATKNP